MAVAGPALCAPLEATRVSFPAVRLFGDHARCHPHLPPDSCSWASPAARRLCGMPGQLLVAEAWVSVETLIPGFLPHREKGSLPLRFLIYGATAV